MECLMVRHNEKGWWVGREVVLRPFGKWLHDRLQLASWGPIPLRVIVGYGFIAHGYAKLARGPDIFIGVVHAIGVPGSSVMAWIAIITELLGGFAVLLGAFVPLVAIPMAIVLLVATFAVHWPYGFTSIKLINVTPAGPVFGPPGYECDLLYLACLATLVLAGSGPYSIDGFFQERWKRSVVRSSQSH
jgi:putative oxidoreductase